MFASLSPNVKATSGAYSIKLFSLQFTYGQRVVPMLQNFPISVDIYNQNLPVFENM